MEELTQLVTQLVEIDSVNPSLVPGGAGEQDIARFVASWLQQAGLEVVNDEIAPGRYNVIAIARGKDNSQGRNLMLNAHLDTVGAGNMLNPNKAVIEKGRLYGRGALDTKAGLAAFMLAAAQAKNLKLTGDVILTAVADEEYASIGTRALLERWQADAAIVTEPTDLDIVVAHKGFIWLEIETTGVAAHGSRPHLGVDAITKMGKVLVEIENLGKTLARRDPHPLLGTASIHASLIEGGQEWSTYPNSCRLWVERRTLPGETVASVETEIGEILANLTLQDPTFKASCKFIFEGKPLELPADNPIVKSVVAQSEGVLGQAKLSGFSGWTDAALLTAANIPALVFGPVGEGLHATVEWVELASVQEFFEIVLAVMEDFCG